MNIPPLKDANTSSTKSGITINTKLELKIIMELMNTTTNEHLSIQSLLGILQQSIHKKERGDRTLPEKELKIMVRFLEKHSQSNCSHVEFGCESVDRLEVVLP